MFRKAARRSALMVPAIRRLLEQRDAAQRELADLRQNVERWRSALTPPGVPEGAMPPWFLPPGPHLATAPQRYTDNYEKYVERGGHMRPPEDIVGFVRRNPYYAYDRARFYFLCLVVDLISSDKLEGDFGELGVDKGNSASVLARAAERLGKKVYLLDTFEGFPEQDLIGNETAHWGDFRETSLGLVKEVVTGPHVRLIKGYFPDTAAQIPNATSFSLVHLDCDLYKPFSSALQYFWPRIVPGGFLIMHDYTTLYWDGVERAVEEFFAEKAESIIPIPDMAGTVAVRKAK